MGAKLNGVGKNVAGRGFPDHLSEPNHLGIITLGLYGPSLPCEAK